MKAIAISKQALVAGVFGAGVAGAFFYAPPVFQQASAKQPISIEQPNGAPISFADLIEEVSPAVVSVNVVSEREVGGMGNMEEFFERFRGLPGFDDYMRERGKRAVRKSRRPVKPVRSAPASSSCRRLYRHQ